MNTPNNIPSNILDGTKERITATLNLLTTGKKEFTTRTSLKEVSGLHGDLKLLDLLQEIWVIIEDNWKRAGRNRGGCENWRWEPQLEINPKNSSAETRIEKNLAANLPPKHWANQVPTASGLISTRSDRRRNIDLAHWDGVETVTLIELKALATGAKPTQTPLLAAFEIIQYALLLCLARAHQTQQARINIVEPKVWLDAKRAHLRVIAPDRFYDKQFPLDWFEQSWVARSWSSENHTRW